MPYYSQYKHQIMKGIESEQIFKDEATRRGYKPVPSPLTINKLAHIDYFITSPVDKITYSVDVKSVGKRGYTIEIQNNQGYPGSIFGEQDIVAYVSKTDILLVPRNSILTLLESKSLITYTNLGPQPSSIVEIITGPTHWESYQLYSRPQWKDLWCIANRSDLKPLSIWRLNDEH